MKLTTELIIVSLQYSPEILTTQVISGESHKFKIKSIFKCLNDYIHVHKEKSKQTLLKIPNAHEFPQIY